jgi:hypothetical protein
LPGHPRLIERTLRTARHVIRSVQHGVRPLNEQLTVMLRTAQQRYSARLSAGHRLTLELF